MPPKRHNRSDPIDVLEQRISNLEKTVKALLNQKIPTIPLYDSSNLPSQAIEGQIAIIYDAS